MKYLKLYEELEGFEETWVDEPEEPEEYLYEEYYPKKFKKFLIENNIFELFHKNFIRYQKLDFQFGYSSLPPDIQYIKERFEEYFTKKDYLYISHAFNWEDTDEGDDFWNTIDDKWLDYIEFLYESFEDFEETWIQEEDNDDNIKKHKLPLLFYNFLKKEKVLDKFINNFENRHPDMIFFDYMKNNKSSVYDFIDNAFIWGYTPEGSGFWYRIDNKWRTKYDIMIHPSINIKNMVLYESFEDFEEIWIDDPESEYDDIPNYKDFKEYKKLKGRTVRVKKNSSILRYFSIIKNVEGKIVRIEKGEDGVLLVIEWDNGFGSHCYPNDLEIKNKIYESFEDFEETWIDEEPKSEYKKFSSMSGIINLQKFPKTTDYRKFIGMPVRVKGHYGIWFYGKIMDIIPYYKKSVLVLTTEYDSDGNKKYSYSIYSPDQVEIKIDEKYESGLFNYKNMPFKLVKDGDIIKIMYKDNYYYDLSVIIPESKNLKENEFFINPNVEEGIIKTLIEQNFIEKGNKKAMAGDKETDLYRIV